MHDPQDDERAMTPHGATLRGAWSFALVSLAGFSIWAFAGRWFYRNVGEAGLYVAIAAVFLGVSGLLLHPLVQGPSRHRRFQTAFLPAFLAYAVVWSAAWFLLRNKAGEWIGSVAGCLTFGTVTCLIFRQPRAIPACAAVLFVTHSAGYFIGDRFMSWLTAPGPASPFPSATKAQLGTIAKLGWGLFYGLGFGAGLGFTFHRASRPPTQITPPA